MGVRCSTTTSMSISSRRETQVNETAPRTDPDERVVLDLGEGRLPAHPGVRRLREAGPPADPDLPVVPEPVVVGRPRSRAGRPSSGFTVNVHQWIPGFEPPYVIANVALADDPSVHLTTNIVGCEPDDVHIGQVVSVVFEEQEDVWLPLFEPTGGDRPRRPGARTEAACPPGAGQRDRFEHRAVLSGVGRSKLGRRLMVDPLSLTVDACLAAVADAGLTLDDIDGLSTYPGGGGHGHERRRGHRGRGGAPAPADVDQRWRRSARAGRRGDRRRHGGRDGAVPPRPLLPHGLGVDLCHAWARRGTGQPPGLGGHAGVARPLRRAVRGQLDRHERQPVPAPLRRHPRDARPHRPQRHGPTRRATRPPSTATR